MMKREGGWGDSSGVIPLRDKGTKQEKTLEVTILLWEEPQGGNLTRKDVGSCVPQLGSAGYKSVSPCLVHVHWGSNPGLHYIQGKHTTDLVTTSGLASVFKEG